MTDYWGPFYNPETLKLLKEGQTLGDYCLEVEAQRGKNIVDAAAGVIGLERFIVSALTDVKGQSNGKYTQVYHFDSKAAIVKYIREVDPKLAQKMSIIQIGSYMSNFIEGMQPRKVMYSDSFDHHY